MSDTSWSYSKYSSALSCLRKYKHVYIDKLQGDESGDLEFGTAIHSAINATLEGEDGELTFSTHWESLKGKEMAYGRFKHGELWEIGLDLVRKFSKMHAPKFTPFKMEQRLYGAYKGIKLEGTGDFYGDYERVPSLFDWKTAGYPYKQEKGLTALQLYLYAYLGIKELGYTPKQLAYLPLVKSGKDARGKLTGSIQKPIIIPFDERVMYEMLDEMLAYLEKLEHNGTYPRQPNSCIMGNIVCPFINKCWGQKEESKDA